MLICVCCRLPFQQDVEYGNTTSHLGDCDGRLQHYDIYVYGCVQRIEGRRPLVAESLITLICLSLNILFLKKTTLILYFHVRSNVRQFLELSTFYMIIGIMGFPPQLSKIHSAIILATECFGVLFSELNQVGVKLGFWFQPHCLQVKTLRV